MNGQPLSPPWHFGLQQAGQTLDWLPCDTEQSYQHHIQDPSYRAYIQQKGWHQPGAITYKINSHGFRSDEFVPGTPCLVALGCSYTVGIGLPVDTVWPSLVAKSLGMSCYNLGWGGTSADTCFMQAQYWILRLKPQLVVMAAPPKHRIDLVTEESYLPHNTFLPAHETGLAWVNSDMYLKQWFVNDRNADLNQSRNKFAVAGLCTSLGIPCLTYNACDWFAKDYIQVEYARDRMHAGPLGHRIAAQQILEDFQKNNT